MGAKRTAPRFFTPAGLVLGLALGTALACLFQHPVVGFLGGAAMGLVLGAGRARI